MVRVVDERSTPQTDEIHHHNVDEVRQVNEVAQQVLQDRDNRPRVVQVSVEADENGEAD